MKKLVSTIALLAMLVIVSSGSSDKELILSEGDQAPKLSLINQSGAVSLDDFEGEYVLLTFWSSVDAGSRVDCNTYSAWFAANKDTEVRHIAVNMDFEPVLFEEIVKLDNLDTEAQYNVQGVEKARIVRDFSLQEGYGSILIDRDGRVAMFNPSLRDLSSL